jgi:hypothetical protein
MKSLFKWNKKLGYPGFDLRTTIFSLCFMALFYFQYFDHQQKCSECELLIPLDLLHGLTVLVIVAHIIYRVYKKRYPNTYTTNE